MAATPAPPPVPPGAVRRVVVLGASNVARGLGRLLRLCRQRSGGPTEAWIAAGHGRSYGQASAVLCRRLPGIAGCRLWTDLELASPLPTWALLTDVGNDLLYDVPVPQIVDWVAACLDRLTLHRAQLCLGLLPLGNLATLEPWRFRFFRQLFVPRCRLSLPTVTQRALELQAQLKLLGTRHQAAMVEPPPRWYGRDPIHIRRACLDSAWSDLTSGWQSEHPPAAPATADLTVPPSARPPDAFSLPHWKLAFLPPAERWWFGQPRHAAQPCWQVPDGSQLRLY